MITMLARGNGGGASLFVALLVIIGLAMFAAAMQRRDPK